MKVTWFAMDCNVYTHPKTLQLADSLKLDVDTTVGKLGRLWAWAKVTGNETGDIGLLPDQELADIMRWKKRAKDLVLALIDCGVIDSDGKRKSLHGWPELNGVLCVKKRKDAERKICGNS